MFTLDDITGTLINYYATCRREAWLYARHIHADQSDDAITMGRALAEIRDKGQDFPFSNLHFDKLEKKAGHYLITEHKKTMSNPEAAKAQLLFYMYLLKTGLKLKKIDGKVISGKTVIYVEGSDEAFSSLEAMMDELALFVQTTTPPTYERTKWCKGCAYKSYCEG
jgi:CRISPR-associated exonuclease Cas4